MKLFKDIKIWIIIALVVVVGGALMISLFGLNQTPDYKTAYEVSVSVDQNVEGSGELAKKTAEKYFNEKGYKFASYATQKTTDGNEYIYKFNTAGNISASELETKISEALSSDEKLGGLGLVAKVQYKQIATNSGFNFGLIILATVLGLVATFIISLLTVKLASALTVLCNAVISAIMYVMLIAITRIPALPDVFVGFAAAVILASAMSFVIACRYKEIIKSGDKSEVSAVAAEGLKTGTPRLYFILGAGALVAVALSVTSLGYPMFTGLKILVATVSAFLTTCVATPALWTVFKSVKNKK